MTSDLLLNDLFLWSLQIAALAGLAALFAAISRLRTPDARLFYWQTVLLACFALPLIRPLRRPVAEMTLAVSSAVVTVAAPQAHRSVIFPWSEIVIGVLSLGAMIRLSLIAAGMIRLRGYRLNSRPFELSSAWDAASTWSVEAELRVSDDVAGPATFGVRRPVVLLPAGFMDMDETARDAVLCHEILHVRRKDWLFTMAEETVRAVFWFHPAVWWALGEIQLAREQTVDRGVIATTKARDQYVGALLAMAGVSGGAAGNLDLPPAPLFLRKRHLKQRVVSILKEVPMSRKRVLSTLAAGVALLGASCWLITGALPLNGAPQIVADAPGVSVNTSGEQLMHRAPVMYTWEAIANGVEGAVVAQVRTDTSGNVIDATVLSGPDELRKSVLQSVLSWHFGKSASPATRQVTVTFTLPKNQAATATGAPASAGSFAPPTTPHAIARLAPAPVAGERASPFPPSVLITKIQVLGLSDDAAADLLRSLPVHENDRVPLDQLIAVAQAVRTFDEHLFVRPTMSPSQKDVTLTIMPADNVPPPPPSQPPSDLAGTPPPPGQIRIGGQIQSANLISQTPPVYPPLAKAARVQGTVRFEATIGKDGSVESLKLISGPPLLVQAATDAAQQWKYKPTLLNNQPVGVITTIDINFTLSDQ